MNQRFAVSGELSVHARLHHPTADTQPHHAVIRRLRSRPSPRAGFPVSPRTGCREPVLAQTARLVPRAEGKANRAHDSTRLVMVILGRMFFWRDALVNVQPNTFLRWHRKGFRLFWRWKSRPVGRPQIPK